MKKVWIALLVVAILIMGFMFTKNVIAQLAIVKSVKAITGLGVELKGMEVGVFKPVVSLTGLKIMNPDGFTYEVMAEFPEFYVRYDLGAFLKGKVHIPEMQIYLSELVVEQNKANQWNVKSLQSFAPKGGGNQGGNQPPPKIQIDLLSLKIDKVIFKTAMTGNARTFDVKIDETFKNITDPKAIADLILVKALSKTTIPSLANLDLGGLKAELSGAAVQQVQGVVASVQEKAQETVAQTQGQLQKLFQK